MITQQTIAWLIPCAVRLHDAASTGRFVLTSACTAGGSMPPLLASRRLVLRWLAAEHVAGPPEQDLSDREEMLRSACGQMMVGMVLCLLGAHREAQTCLRDIVVPRELAHVWPAWQARAAQCLGQHEQALRYWARAAGAAPPETGLASITERSMHLRAALLSGDERQPLRQALLQAERLNVRPQLESAVGWARVQAALNGGRPHQARAAAIAWVDVATTPGGMYGALCALAMLGMESAIDPLWRGAASRLDAGCQHRLALLVTELYWTLGRGAEAMRMLQARMRSDPDCLGTRARLAWMLVQSEAPGAGTVANIESVMESASAGCAEDAAWSLYARATAEAKAGKVDVALRLLRAACLEAPDWWRCRWALGELQLRRGDVTLGLDNLNHAVELAYLAQGVVVPVLQPLPADARLVSALVRSLSARPMAPELRQCLLRAAGAACWRQGDAAQALALLERAADQPAGPEHACVSRMHRALAEDVLATFTHARAQSWVGWGLASAPVAFVVGLPEAGQSIIFDGLLHVAEVALCHDDGLLEREIGELEWKERDNGTQRFFPACLDDLTKEDVSAIAERLMQRLAQAAVGERPDLFVLQVSATQIGFVKLMFPRAPIVWCRRQHRAHALSVHTKDDRPRWGRFASLQRLTWIGERLVDEARLMQRWQQLHGREVLVVERDWLEASPGVWLAAIFQHLGLHPLGSTVDLPRCREQPAPALHGLTQIRQLDAVLRRRLPLPLPLTSTGLEPGLLQRSIRLLAAGRADQACHHLQSLLEACPDHAQAHFELGRTMSRLGRPHAAWQAFRCAVDLRPQHTAWRRRLVVAQHRLISAALDQVCLLLADRGPGAAAMLLFAVETLAQATPDVPLAMSRSSCHGLLDRLLRHLEAEQVIAEPALVTRQATAEHGQLPGHSRIVFLKCSPGREDGVSRALMKIGLHVRSITRNGIRLLNWPAQGFSVVLLPMATDEEVWNDDPPAAVRGVWARCEAIQRRLDTPRAAAPASGISAETNDDDAKAAVAALQRLLSGLPGALR